MSLRALARALQQLEIVDDDQADAVLPLHAAGAGAQRGDGEARRVVDVERQRLELAGGAREVAEILLADLAHAEVLRADPRLLGEDAGGELVGRHFEAEEGDRRAGRLSGAMPSSMSRRKRCAALKAMLVASEVLPMPGRPARMIRSELCRPPILALIGRARW